MAHPLLSPQPTHQGDAFVEPGRPLAEADAECVELRLAVAQADAKDVVAASQHVERGGFLSHMMGLSGGRIRMFGPIVMPCACAAT